MNRCARTCYNCKFYRYDASVDASDCDRANDIPEELFEKHFVNDEPNCPFFEEIEDIDYPYDFEG